MPKQSFLKKPLNPFSNHFFNAPLLNLFNYMKILNKIKKIKKITKNVIFLYFLIFSEKKD